jgi:D-lactate dehydrogenase (cytochrome)
LNQHTPHCAVDATISELRARFGDRLSTSRAVRDQHGKDATHHPALPPDAVVFAENAEDVQFIVRVCAKRQVPIIAYGAGTSLEGHVNAPYGGITINLSRMNRILAVNAADMDVTVEPGVTRKQLNDELRDTGLFFPIDPGADASIGGMASTRASGTNAVRYGTMRENVIALEAVLANGDIVRTGTRARKSSAGYDLTGLLVGSEGTLAILTQITLRIHGIPESIAAAVCPFSSLEGAVSATIETIQLGIPVARIELLDDVQMEAIARYSKLPLPRQHTLFLEFHGSQSSVREQAETFRGIAREHGGADFRWADKPEERTVLWQARHDALWAAKALRPGSEISISDVCVPISELASCILETRREIDAAGLTAPIVGHVGDGNFHALFLFDPANQEEVDLVTKLNKHLVRRALAAGGTCTGEHGVGMGKISYLRDEHGPGTNLMLDLKRALDPCNILNPGKIVKWDRSAIGTI